MEEKKSEPLFLTNNGPLLNLVIAAVGSLACLGPLFGMNEDAGHLLATSSLKMSIQSQHVTSSLIGVIICTIPMITDLALDLFSREKTFSIMQDVLARAFISVVVLVVASTLLTVSSLIPVREVLVGMVCAKILISGGFLARICLFDREMFSVRATYMVITSIIINSALRLYAATIEYTKSMANLCIASSALVLFACALLSLQCLVKLYRKLRQDGFAQIPSHDFISLAFVAAFVALATGDIIVTFSYGLYSSLLIDASPGCLSAIIYILVGSMITMNIAEGRHVRALIVDAKVKKMSRHYFHPFI